VVLVFHGINVQVIGLITVSFLAILITGISTPTVPRIAIKTIGVDVTSIIFSSPYINKIRTTKRIPAPNTNRYDCATPV